MSGGLAAKLQKVRGVHKLRFVRETAIMQGGMVVTLFTYLLTSVLLARGLGPHEFGRYTTAFALYSFAFFIGNLGVTTVTVSRYARATGEKDQPARVAALASFLKAFGLMSAFLLLLGLALPPLAGMVYDDRGIGWYALALCLLGPVEMMNAFMLVTLQGGRRPQDYALYDNACGVTRLFAILFALLAFGGLKGVVIAYLVSGVFYTLFAVRLYQVVRREAHPVEAPPPLRDVLRAVPRADIHGLFSTGTQIALGKNGAQMLRNFALLLVGNEAGNIRLAHFRVAFTYIWAIQQLLGGLQRTFLPVLGVRMGASGGDFAKFRHDVIKVCVVSGLLFIAVTAVFVIAAPLAIHLLYGPQYEGAVELVYVMAVGHLVLGFSVVSEAFYIYTGKVALGTRLNVAMLVILAVLAFVLVKLYGVDGGAWLFVIAQLFGIVHLAVIGWTFTRPPPDKLAPA